MAQETVMTISEKEFNQLAGFVKRNYGINLGHEKKALVLSRLGNVLAQNDIQSFTQYFEYVASDTSGDAMITLLDKITTNHTFFMRETDHFDYLRNKGLPYFAASIANRDLRIWSAGCSSGEEPYTLAMIIDEYFGEEKLKWNTRILATDISTSALDIAKRAEYTDEHLDAVPGDWKLRYFRKTGVERNILIDKIRNEVVFRRFNLMEESFPFKRKFHSIYCRNVMIYFDTKTKQELVNKFYNFTEPGGYLFIGHSETLNNLKTEFKYVMPAVYRKE